MGTSLVSLRLSPETPFLFMTNCSLLVSKKQLLSDLLLSGFRKPSGLFLEEGTGLGSPAKWKAGRVLVSVSGLDSTLHIFMAQPKQRTAAVSTSLHLQDGDWAMSALLPYYKD